MEFTKRDPKTIEYWRGDLPHWQVEDGRFFVTIHLNGAIPKAGQIRIREIAEQFRNNQQTDRVGEASLKLSRKIFREMEAWLDRMSHVKTLADNRIAAMLVESIDNRQSRCIWNMFEFVVMPSHIHLFFELNERLSLRHELNEFKRWTGHQAAKLNARQVQGRFWQTEWFDHWSRSDSEDEKIVNYIRMNPVVAGLVKDYSNWEFRGSLTEV